MCIYVHMKEICPKEVAQLPLKIEVYLADFRTVSVPLGKVLYVMLLT